MKILLLGEYSNVHATLANGLRQLGHEVTVASDGDGWKNYPRDVNLARHSTGKWDTCCFMCRLWKAMSKFRGYDVVQVINPMFLELKAERILPYYKYLRRHNKSVFMGAFGMDRYWVAAGINCKTFRYSDFNLGEKERFSADNEQWINEWIYGAKGDLNTAIARDCDGIISGLYEYDASYRPFFKDKLQFIPFPIDTGSIQPKLPHPGKKIQFFIGIQKSRSVYKGTDVMLRALQRVAEKYPDRCEVIRVESIPFLAYQDLMNHSDVLLDQLYSYTPAMNALLAMAKGLIVVSGGEPENYEILGETELRPIINVQPTEESVYHELEQLVLHPERLTQLSKDSVTYIKKHHDHVKVAQQYVDFWTQQQEIKKLLNS
jgi:glycosyltransferase involved in cell wall biosynthesis